MSDNVIILGAGFSRAAGIPLLGGFVERMWEFAARKVHKGKPLSAVDVAIFEDAIKVRNGLDRYHGRAVFDDRNIEDVLSLLSFNAMGGGREDRAKLARMNRAIAKTIELCCEVTHPGVSAAGEDTHIIETGPDIYRAFWRALFSRSILPETFPTLITFNYDLVLERALVQTLNSTHYDGHSRRAPFGMLDLRYYHKRIAGLKFLVNKVQYQNSSKATSNYGTALEIINDGSNQPHLEVELLKLHGSLNFPRRGVKFDNKQYNFVQAIEDPGILPPISNKMSGDVSTEMWSTALQRLRAAKNVIVVGYSLPKTDIYMQYFLKAALGPNIDLNKISVFDPVLHSGSSGNNEMRERYQECFATQLHQRIDFNPAVGVVGDKLKGTAEHFISALHSNPDDILF